MELIATKRNVLVNIQLDNKTKLKFKSGVELFICKTYNYNLREDNPSICTIIDGGDLPKGSLALIHHNSVHDTYKISGIEDEEGNIMDNLFSIPNDMVFCYKEDENKEWIPNKDFLITLRVYKPYGGVIAGIRPDLVKQRLYVVKGEIEGTDLVGKVAVTTNFSDYEIIFREGGIEKSVIRTRSREILGIDLFSTSKVLSGEYLVGNNLDDIKTVA